VRVLVACESSGAVRDAFIRAGHYAASCDLLPSESPLGDHYQCDATEILDHGWDLLIAHPPCTYLSVSGMHWTTRGLRDPKLTEDALDFVRLFMEAPIERIAIENPVSVISSRIRKPDQIIQPYQFGHDASKKTCLWLKGLPLLKPTQMVEPRMVCCGVTLPDGVGKHGCPDCCGEKAARPRWGNQTDSGQNKLPPSKDRWKLRSKTYEGIADAMAAQWS
jgi:hypothetical protein